MTKQRFFLSAAAAVIAGFAVGAVAAQNGTAETPQQKQLDDKKLTPIRRVGPKDWPAANPLAEAPGQNEKAKQASQNNPPAQSTSGKHETTGQAPSNPPVQTNAQTNTQTNSAQQKSTQPNAQATQTQSQAPQAATSAAPQSAQNKPGSAATKQAHVQLGADAEGRVAVNASQQQQLSAAVTKQHVQPVNISAKVGMVVPNSVQLGAVSADIVAVLPQFSGYSYFATREDIVIVEPSTKQVVALVPVTLSATAERPAPKPEHEKTAVKKSHTTEKTTITRRAPRERDVTVGAAVREEPSTTTVIHRRAPETHYRVIEEDRPIVVEPADRGPLFFDDDD